MPREYSVAATSRPKGRLRMCEPASSIAFEIHDSRPVVLLLHPFPFDRRIWAPQAEVLGDVATVIAVDLPGFGESPPAGASLDLWADRVDGLLDELIGEHPVVALGLSMGGYVALRLTARHPGRVEALVLADTRAGADTPEGRAARDQAISAVRDGGTEAIVPGLLEKLVSPDTDPSVVDQVRGLMLKQDPGAVADALLAMRDRPDSTPVLESFEGPALVIVGTRDVLTPPVEAEAMAAGIASSWLVRIPGVGHLSNVEAPEEFNAAVAAFLQML